MSDECKMNLTVFLKIRLHFHDMCKFAFQFVHFCANVKILKRLCVRLPNGCNMQKGKGVWCLQLQVDFNANQLGETAVHKFCEPSTSINFVSWNGEDPSLTPSPSLKWSTPPIVIPALVPDSPASQDPEPGIISPLQPDPLIAGCLVCSHIYCMAKRLPGSSTPSL